MLKKRMFWVVVAVVVAAVGFGWMRVRAVHAKNAVHFDTVAVDRGRIVAKVTASGSLSAIVTVQVGSQVSGRIQRILVDFNSPVRKGELIAKIDPQLFEAAYQQARANFVAAQGNLAKSKAQAQDAARQYTRAESLAARKLIAQADLDTAQSNSDAAKAQVEASNGNVEQARAGLHQAEINLAYTDIYSPTDGVVISRNVDVGQTVAASLQAPTLFVIAEDLRKMQVDTSVAEADIGKLRAGMPATFTVDAYPGERFKGSVRQIRNAPQTVQNVVTYDAVIDIDNSGLRLKPGMTANVTFISAERDDVLRVPNAALRFRPSGDLTGRTRPANGAPQGAGPRPPGVARGGGERADASDRHSIWVLDQGKLREVAIRAGVSDGTLTEVVEGELAEGERVITDMSSGADARGSLAGGNFPRRMF